MDPLSSFAWGFICGMLAELALAIYIVSRVVNRLIKAPRLLPRVPRRPPPIEEIKVKWW